MSTAGIIFGATLTLAVLIVIGLPFVWRQRDITAGQTVDELEAHYERVLINIRDLDEDHALGKISDDFYQSQRQKFTAEGVELLQALDAATPTDTETTATDEDDLDALIESAVARRKQTTQAN